jgi:hypothetical protein
MAAPLLVTRIPRVLRRQPHSRSYSPQISHAPRPISLPRKAALDCPLTVAALFSIRSKRRGGRVVSLRGQVLRQMLSSECLRGGMATPPLRRQGRLCQTYPIKGKCHVEENCRVENPVFARSRCWPCGLAVEPQGAGKYEPPFSVGTIDCPGEGRIDCDDRQSILSTQKRAYRGATCGARAAREVRSRMAGRQGKRRRGRRGNLAEILERLQQAPQGTRCLNREGVGEALKPS